MSEQREPGWYPQPNGSQRYWDGDTWLGVIPPAKPPVETLEQQAQELQSSAWTWALLGLLFTPLAIVGIVRNADARRVGRNAGVRIGWGPTIMACVLLAFAALWFLFWISGGLAGA